MEEIPQRILRNDISRVLQSVRAGKSFRITVGGAPVAELRPVDTRPRFVPLATVLEFVAKHPLDPGFEEDVRAVMGQTIDTMRDVYEM